jgi:fatty-acyl-CoA synthase
MENRTELLEMAWGAQYAGLHYTFFSTHLTPAESAYIIDDCGADLVVLTPHMAAELMPELAEHVQNDVTFYSVCGSVVLGDGRVTDDLFALADEFDGSPIPAAMEGAPMLYSSGTTGQPKGVKRPRSGNPLGTTCTVGRLCQAVAGAGPESLYLSPGPLYHAAPLRFSLDFMAIGAAVVVMDRFDAEGVLAAIDRFGVTHAQFVPTMFIRMLRLPHEVRDRYDLATLRAAIHAAAPCPIPVKHAMVDWWGPVIHEYYAGSEGIGLTWVTSEEWLERPGTVGRAYVGEIHIVSADDEGDEETAGVELGPHQEGYIYFSGGATFEYHNAPDKTAGAHLGNGWATLGDFGYIDDNGYLYLVDRRTNLIISGGVNIYPQETENTLTGHPAVYDVAVIGVPNEEYGQEVKAVVQLAPGYEAGDDLAAELIDYCREHLSSIKCPRSVDFRPELPRMPSGKLFKRKLRDEYWAEPG